MILCTVIGFLILSINQSYELGSFPKDVSLTIGVVSTNRGKEQNINVQGFIGDRYTVTKRHDENLFFSFGFLNPYNDTFDARIGPNIIRTKNFRDFSRDDGITIPNNAFLNKTQVEFAASGKIGVLFKNAFKSLPIEFDYRYFYLGQGKFRPRTNLILDPVKTGESNAHNLTISTFMEG